MARLVATSDSNCALVAPLPAWTDIPCRIAPRYAQSPSTSVPAIGQSPDDPIAHMQVREQKGIRPGGFGLLMVRDSVDELIYNEKRNEVVFVKYLSDPAARPASDTRPRKARVKES